MTATRTAFITGGTGLIGGALVDALVASGVGVRALTRTADGARRLAARGAEVIRGDIGEVARWEDRVADAEVVFHLGLPRLIPPVRRRHIRKARREAGVGAEIIREIAGDRTVIMASCAIGDAGGALEITGPALAAEAAMRGPGTRIVRLPWAYGPAGFICDVSRGLQMRRFRMVGPAANRIAIVGALDAAAALVCAADAPPGTYAVAESDAPTQEALVHHICAGRGAPRPDHVPPRMAAMSMGSVVVDALTADQVVEGAPPPGFTFGQAWEQDLVGALEGT